MNSPAPQAATRFRGAAAVIMTAAALVTAACGSSPAAPAQPAASGSPMHHPMTHPAAAMVGSDCAMIPASGPGSAHSMAMQRVVTAAAHIPLLTTFARDAARTGLAADLNTMHSFTVFAPANSAFAGLPAAAMTMLHNTADLTKTLKNHVVTGRITPAQIAGGTTVTTIEGGHLKLSKMGAAYEVSNASVLCGNLQTANATVYIISKVLTPAH